MFETTNQYNMCFYLALCMVKNPHNRLCSSYLFPPGGGNSPSWAMKSQPKSEDVTFRCLGCHVLIMLKNMGCFDLG